MFNLIIFEVNGSKIEKQLEKKPSLKELQEIVGGYVSKMVLKDEMCLLYNEDAKLMKLPINRLGTQILRSKYFVPNNDCVAGTVVYCSSDVLN